MTQTASPPKNTVVLHIGMNKTATTSIQQSLAGYDDGTSRYARLGDTPNHSVALITAFSTTPEQHHHHVKRGASAETLAARGARLRARLTAELNSPARTLILSGEGVTGLRRPEIETLRTTLESTGRQVRVIAYLRDPAGFAISSFQQIVKGGSPRFELPPPRYRKRFNKFIRVFGPLEFVAFDPPQFRNGCIITDFCDRTGLDIARVTRLRANESLSALAVALLLEWNRTGMKSQGSPERMHARGQVIAALARQFPGKLRLHPDLVRRTEDAEDCAWIEQTAGFALPRSSTSPQTGTPDPDVITGEAMLRALPPSGLPGLREILTASGLRADGDTPVALMDRLFEGILTGTTAPPPAPSPPAAGNRPLWRRVLNRLRRA